jgi:hypothetical protein
MEVLTFGKIAYVPIWKNATSTFRMKFSSLGWTTKHIDHLDESYELFGHIRHPKERHFKGVAQYLVINQLDHLLDDPIWQKVLSTALLDAHSYSIYSMLGKHVSRIKWIPISPGIDTMQLTIKYLKSKNIEIDNLVYKNRSYGKIQHVYHQLQEINKKFDTYNIVSLSFDGDLALWNSIFPYVDEDNIEYMYIHN